MVIDQRVTIEAPIDRVWVFVSDVPSVAKCVNGVESIVERDGAYFGTLQMRVGPIRTRLEGRLLVTERNGDTFRTRVDVAATDRLLGSAITARMTIQLAPLVGDQTELMVHTEASVLGKLGQLGQGIIQRQADSLMAQFAKNVTAAVQRDRHAERPEH